MDRARLIREITAKGIPVEGGVLKVVKELGRGGNGVAFRCGDSHDNFIVAKIYIPPDNRDLDERSLARFEREIKLSTALRHPNVIRALASGTLKIGAYTLPFYTMPLAPKTLRDAMKPWADADSLDRLLRVFLKAARGVVFLHSNQVVHRDLKPENVLIADDGTPWIADLGIAHVNPQFVSGSLKTIEKEHLLNRDYYAPEQRFGSAVDVDQRADIYALGCILYEIILGTPPVRNNCPSLSSRDEALGYLDPVFNRMTAYSPEERYQRLEDALDDMGIQAGWVLATLRGDRPAVNRDVPTMAKLLKSSNEAHRRRGTELAKELGKEALEVLHELLGHSRRDVRDAAALALGEIAEPNSLPYLIAALYGNTRRPSSFRPSSDKASAAIGQYPPELRLKACGEIRQPVRPIQVLEIINDLPTDLAYGIVSQLVERKLLLLDWTETEAELLITIDADRVWPQVEELFREGNGFKLKSLLKHLSVRRKAHCIKLWLNGLKYSWYLEDIFEEIRRLEADGETKKELFDLILSKVIASPGSLKAREDLIKYTTSELGKLSSESGRAAQAGGTPSTQ